MGRQITAQVIRALKALERRIAREIRVDRMILFGSRARGDWLLTSDADPTIVSPDFEGRRFVDRSAEILRTGAVGVTSRSFAILRQRSQSVAGKLESSPRPSKMADGPDAREAPVFAVPWTRSDASYAVCINRTSPEPPKARKRSEA
jgi:hypothetical protein